MHRSARIAMLVECHGVGEDDLQGSEHEQKGRGYDRNPPSDDDARAHREARETVTC
jgi:hypothetical protein